MKYIADENLIKLDAAELCLLALGEDYSQTLSEAEAADEVAANTEGYEKSALISAEFKLGDRNIEMSGTAAGIFKKRDGVRIDRVRCVSDKEFQKRPKDEFYTYTKCCAWLVCLRDGLDFVYVRGVLKNSESGEYRAYEKKLSRSELEIFVKLIFNTIYWRIEHIVRQETLVRPSAENLVFPYGDIREGQDEMMRGVTSVIKKGGRMFAQAPTGIGKTISVLYPSVRAFGKGSCDKIFYFTAKTETAREAYSATGRLHDAGAKLRTIVLASKDSMCCSQRAKIGGCRDQRYCNERDCPYKRRYKDKAPVAIAELIAKQNGFYPAIISETAIKYEVCPYELSLDLSELCEVIICDYNYLFDPFVRLKRYFESPLDFGEYVFLIDEAHNLVDRARAIYSATVSQNAVLEAYELARLGAVELCDSFADMAEAMKKAKKLCKENRRKDEKGNESGYYISRVNPEFFAHAAREFEAKLDKWIKHNKESELYEVIDRLHSDMRKFVGILEYYDDKFMTYVELFGGDLKVSLNCIDPSDILDDVLSLGRASVMFSATLAPLSYFCDLLGGSKKSLCVELPSPYKQENLCIAAVDTVSTRFEDRDKSYKKVATCIAAAVSPKAGNYIVYFPSYGYLEKVHEAFVKKYPKVRTIVQRKGMNRAEHAEFIESFKDDENKMRIGFCVLGGSFSEGVDLPGNRLIGSIIVGVGLPGFSSERNIMRDYFENRYENGFEYAYTYPGMNNVLQAAGRVIRREEDKGIVVLIDDRYSEPTYKKLFPKHWSHLMYAGDAASLAEIINRFWASQE